MYSKHIKSGMRGNKIANNVDNQKCSHWNLVQYNQQVNVRYLLARQSFD